MAEEAASATQLAVTKTKEGGGKSPVIMLVIASALVMILTPVITIVVMRALAPSEAKAVDVLKTIELPLDPVQVNVAETNGTRYAQLDIVVELSDRELIPYFGTQNEENPMGLKRRMMSSIISIVSSKDLDGLLTAEAKLALADEVRESLNSHLRKVEAKGLVTEVYFTGFLVQ